MIHFDYDETPQVLFLGNGLMIPSTGLTWGGFLKKISVREDLPEKLTCPEPLQAILATNNNIRAAMNRHQKQFMGETTSDLQHQLRSLLALRFDDILTTNYSYEIESAAAGRPCVSEYFLKKTCANLESGKKIEPKYLLQTCQQIEYDGYINRIWHIHGEARKPDSMILGHYYYASLLDRIMMTLRERKDQYLVNQQNHKAQTMKSWVDSFILGDVYILGFGCGVSEFDIWWLLNRKLREKAAHGKVYFYEPGGDKFNEKFELLRLLDVKIENCGIPTPDGSDEEKTAIYRQFYAAAMTDIASKVHAARNTKLHI